LWGIYATYQHGAISSVSWSAIAPLLLFAVAAFIHLGGRGAK
jgi:hypothetical protein